MTEEPMIAASLLALALTLPAGQDTSRGPVRSVGAVDLARYAGRWHEVARFPNRFQAKCAGETTADYALLTDGQIRVVNTCRRADGEVMRAEGRARLARAGGPTSQLKVRFAPRFLSLLPFVWGDYWILDLTDDYRAVLVGSPNRDYLWILAHAGAGRADVRADGRRGGGPGVRRDAPRALAGAGGRRGPGARSVSVIGAAPAAPTPH